MINKTFCVLPWVHVAVKTGGSFRLCCNHSTLPQDLEMGGLLKGKHVTDTSVAEMWNSRSYRELRKRMIKGEPSGPCGRCYREEESGMRSARMSNNADWLNRIGDIDPNGFASLDSIQYVDIRLGNKCNLKCRMCNPYSSNRWIEDEKILHCRDVPDDNLKSLEKVDWFNSDFFWDNLFSAMKNCKVLYISGGEPTLFTEQQFKLFDKCIEAGISKNILIRYNTNLTTDVSVFEKYWRHFRHIKINCSIDGFGKVNDYIRYPSRWKTIEKNLLAVYNLVESKKFPISTKVMATPQMYNIFDLVNLFDYLKQFKLFPYLNILNQPEHYNIRVLKKEQKETVDRIINDWYKKNEEWLIKNDSRLKSYEKLEKLVEYMWKEDWSHLYADFLKEARALDELRNQKLEDYVPELVD